MSDEASARYVALRNDTLALFGPIMATARRADAAEAERRLTAAKRHLERGQLTVLVCGEFKRGKSSLINAILEDRSLLPVNEHAATSIVTKVGYGPRERIVIHRVTPDGKREDREIGRHFLKTFVTHTGNPDNEKGITLVEIEVPNERLRSGLTLVDTPGIGGVYAAHTAATTEALADADAIVFVTDAIMPLNASELRFLRYAAEAAEILDDEDALLFVITKIDIPASYREIAADTTAKVAQATGWPRDHVRVIPVSSLAKLNYGASGDDRDRQMSNFAELDQLIWAALHRRQCKALLGRALSDLDLTARELLQPIEYEIALWRSREHDSLTEPAGEYDRRKRELAEVEAVGAIWRNELAEKVAAFCREAEQEACASAERIIDRAKISYLGDEPPRSVETLNTWLAEDLVDVFAKLDRALAKGAEQVQREFSRRSDLNLGYTPIRSLAALPGPAAGIGNLPQQQQRQLRGVLRKVWTNSPRFRTASTAGVVIGRVVGTIVAPGPGTFIGQAAGGAAGAMVGGLYDLRAARRQAASEREKLRADITSRLEQLSRKIREHIKDGVTRESADFVTAITAEFDSRITQSLESIEGSARRARDSGLRNAAHARERLAELTAERAPLDWLRTRVAELAELATELTAEDNPDGEEPARGHR